jgi:hypothetical protein
MAEDTKDSGKTEKSKEKDGDPQKTATGQADGSSGNSGGTTACRSGGCSVVATNPSDPRLLQEAKKLYRALDFPENGMLFGFQMDKVGWPNKDEEEYHAFVVREENRYGQAANPETLTVSGREYQFRDGSLPNVEGRWQIEDIRDFFANPSAPENLLEDTVEALKTYVDLSDEVDYYLIATWSIGTYLYPLFPAYPFLLFFGTKYSGKSRTLECLNHICFNAKKMKSITVAAMGDIVESMRATILLDQAEKISKTMVGYLADSYKREGGKRSVIERKKGKRYVREFSTYSPKAFGTTKELHYDLLDRCCRITVRRTLKKVEELLGDEPVWAKIRNGMYRFALVKCFEVRDAYRRIESDGTRQGELWRPLEAVLTAAGAREDRIGEVRDAFQRGTAITQDKLSIQEEALFQVLYELSRKHQGKTFDVPVTEISKKLKDCLDKKDMPSSQWIGKAISTFGLAEEVKKRTKFKTVHYQFNEEKVADIINRYEPHIEESGTDDPFAAPEPVGMVTGNHEEIVLEAQEEEAQET